MKILFFYVFLLIFSSQNIQNGDHLLELVQKLEKSDGSNFKKVAFQLSKALITSDLDFFYVMSSRPVLFEEWINKIQYHTFTDYSTQDSIDRILSEAKLTKLKEIMLEHTIKFEDDDRYKKFAKRLIEQLKVTKIRFID